MTITVTITKHFHKDIIALKKGENFVEKMTFVNWKAATDWGRDVNNNHAKLPYHVTNIYQDSHSIVYNVSDIWDRYGLGN